MESTDLSAPRVTAPDQVLVKIQIASVDAIDVSLLDGTRGRQLRGGGRGIEVEERGVALGRDLVGVVADVGVDVENLKVGDQVKAASKCL